MSANIVSADNIKDLLSIKIKSRYDNFGDQYHRIIMVKLFLVCSFVMGFSWFTDAITCIVPESANIDGKFVSAACWIQGVYIYRVLSGRTDGIAYYGIPREINKDGLTVNNFLCQATSRDFGGDKYPNPAECKPMEKTYYVQYQWMPFYIASLAVLYYLPYLLYAQVNSDLHSLRDSIKNDNKADSEKAKDIAEHYFSNKPVIMRSLRYRVFMNILVKIFYFLAGIVAFFGTDNLINGDFVPYGTRWLQWSSLNNTYAYDYMGLRGIPKPGNVLLPPFGYCEVWESVLDKLVAKTNQFKFVCELSQNILYQYCLIVIWWLMVIGLVTAVIGLIWLLVKYILKLLKIRRWNSPARALYNKLTIREMEYLDFIKKKNLPLYEMVIDELKKNEYLERDRPNHNKNSYAPNQYASVPTPGFSSQH